MTNRVTMRLALAVSLGAFPGALLAGALGASGCSDPCCTIESTPITLLPPEAAVENAGLKVRAQDGTGMLTLAVDSGAALPAFRARTGEGGQTVMRSFDVLDGIARADGTYPVRARVHEIEVLPLSISAVDGVIGGAFLQNFSVAFRFAKPSVTFWSRQGADDGFLAGAGFAVLHFDPLGGGELLNVKGRPDFLGLSGPVEVPATRVVVRGCGVPKLFDFEAAIPEACCARGDEVLRATGANLSLLVATGVGPLVLSQSAWARIMAAATEVVPPTPTAGPGLVLPLEAEPLDSVLWSTLPRLALVDQEVDDASNPGACVELGRSRRLQWVENQAVNHASNVCVQVCDTDSRQRGRAQNAAAYVELAGDIPVAIVPDTAAFLQGLRAEVRPEGPEIDGLIGAAVMKSLALEIDYRSQPARLIMLCEPGTPAETCHSSPRCPRLEEPGQERSCFGLAKRSLPATCEVRACD